MNFDIDEPTALTLFAIASLSFGAMLLVIWRADPDERGGAIWGAAFLANGLRWLLILLERSGAAWAGYLAGLSLSAALGLALLGAFWLERRRTPTALILTGALVVGGVLAAIRFAGPQPIVFGASRLPPVEAAVATLALGATAVVMLAAWRRERDRHMAALALILGLWSGIFAAFFVVAPSPAFDNFSVIVRAALQMAAAVTVALMLQARLTRRLRAEIAERASAERRFQDMVELATDWHWEMDREMRFTYHSANITEITGLPASHYLGKTREELFPSQAPTPEWARFKSLFAARQPIRKLVMRSAVPGSGKPIVFEVSGKPIFDESGAFTGYRGTGRDLTTHVATEAALEAIVGGIGAAVGTDYFRALVLHLARTLRADLVFVGRLDEARERVRSLAFWCDGAITENFDYALAGTPCERVYGQGICVYRAGVADRFPDDAGLRRHRVEGYFGAPLIDASGRPIGHVVLMTRNPLEATSLVETVLPALAPRAAAELERQAADERLRASEQRFREVLDNMPIGFVLKRGTRFLMVNRTYAKWIGLAPQEVEAMTDKEVRERLGWPQPTQAKVSTSQQQVAETGEPALWETRLPLADGKTHDCVGVTFRISAPTGDDAGAAENIIGVAMNDVTQLRELESSLAQAQKMDALGRLAGGIAHDFNNIVGAIAGYARFVAEDAERGSTTRQYAERIQDASNRAKDLIQQILAFSRRTELVREPVRLADVISQAAGLLKPLLPGTAGLEFDPGSADVTIEADVTQLAQVILNICLNACQAMGGRSGSVTLRVTTHDAGEAAPAIDRPDTIHALPDGGSRYSVGALTAGRRYACIAVADEGDGMAPETLARIFEPFFTTKPKGQGTGLGLPVVHGIVLAHGGAITVESRHGHGTTFRIWLPIAESAGARQPGPAPSVAPAGKGRVLVIDDDVHFGDMIAVCLERLGYETAIVDNPVAGLATFNEDPALWDLVLTDQTMPELSGIETIRRIKQVRPQLPCILCTGFAHPTSEETARGAGANAYLTKPVDLAVLAQVVAHLTHKDVIDGSSRPA